MYSESSFCEANIILSMRGELIGKIAFTRRPSATAVGGSTNRTSKATRWRAADVAVTNTSVPAVSSKPLGARAEIMDPLNPRFKLTYEFQGTSIARNDVLSASLDAMVTVAKHALEPFDSLEATSTPGPAGSDCIILIDKQSGNPEVIRFSPKIGRALVLIWRDIMLEQDRWGGILFDVLWDGKLVAFGLVGSLNPSVAVTAA